MDGAWVLRLLGNARSRWSRIPGWLRIAVPVGAAALALWRMNAGGITRALTYDEMARLLETIITVSGIALGLVFMFLVGELFTSQSKFDSLLATLAGREGKVLDFLRLCDQSGNSYELWHEMPSRFPDRYEEVWEEIGKHRYVGAVALCKAIRDLGDKWLCIPESGSERAPTRPAMTAETLGRVRYLSNQVWYALDRREGTLDEYLRDFNVTSLVRDMPFIERMAARVYNSESGERFTSLRTQIIGNR